MERKTGHKESEADNKIVRAITSTTCVMLLAKLLAMVRSMLQARVFGAGADVDAFTQANNYSIILFSTVAYALCVAAIPLFTQKLLADREGCRRTANRLISNTLVLILLATFVLAVLAATGGLEGAFSQEETARLFRQCFLALLPALPVITLTYLFLGLFQSMGHYTLQGTLSFLYNLVLCAVLPLIGHRMSLSAYAGLTAACWLLQLAMTFPAMKKERYRFRLSVDLRDREYWSFLRTGAASVFNSSLFLLCYLLNTQFASGAAGGTISSFYYADRLYEPLTTTLIYSVSIVLFPQFSQQYRQMEPAEYRQHVVHVLKNTLLLVLPVSLLFAAFGTPVIQVLFEGGSFTHQDTLLCGEVFSLYALGMAGFFMLDILNKAYYAMGRTLTPICVTAGALALCALLNGLTRAFLPETPQLLAAGTSLAFLLAGIGMYAGFARRGGCKMPIKQLFWGVLFSLFLGGGAFWGYRRFLSELTSKVTLVAVCGGIGLVCLALYLVLMGPMVPTQIIWSKLKRKKAD